MIKKFVTSLLVVLLLVAMLAPTAVKASPAFPTVEATNHSAQADPTTSHTVSLPAGIQADETLLVFFVCQTKEVVTFPEGWTKLFEGYSPLNYNTLAIGWRKADGGEGASITLTTVGSEVSVHISHRISGATDPTITPPEVSIGAGGSSANPDPDILTPTGGSKEYLWIAVEGNPEDDLVTDYPTNYNDNQETYYSSLFGYSAIGIATRNLETDSEDPGAFTITASRRWKACTVAVYPAVAADPPTVTTQAATNVGATTATGNGNITAVNNESCDIRGFVWDLATHGDPGNVAPGASGYANDVPESNGFGTGAFTGSLTGLPPDDTIYVRAYAHNENGYGYGGEINFLTESGVPPTVVTVVCSGFDTDWAIVNASITAEGVDTVVEVGFDYGLTTGYGSSSTKTGSWTTDDEFWIRLTGLTAGTVYHFRAKARNTDGWGYGSDAVFSTEGSLTLYEYLNTGGDAVGDDIYAGNWAYMQFTVGTVAHSLDFTNIYVIRTGASPGDAVLSIKHADAANKPTGADLDVITLDADLFSAALDWVKFDFPNDITLEAGESYALVLRCPNGTAANYLEWRWDAGGGLASAIAGKSTDSGITWTAEGTADYLFENWGEPVLEVLNAQVFTGYIETGDWLVVTTYRNYFKPHYPNKSCPEYFYLRLLDDTTMVAQGSCPAWGYRPGAFYFSKALADSMEWGATDYKIRLYGSFTGHPYTDYNILAADWRGADLEFLDSWVIQQAGTIGDDIGVTLTTTVTDKGEVLNSAGRAIFTLGIYALADERTDIFEYVLHQTEYEENEYAGTLQATTDWRTKVGATVGTWLTSGGMLLGITGQEVGMMIIVMLMLLIIAILAKRGHLPMGIMLAFVPMLIGVWLGFISYIILGVVVLVLGGGMFAYKVWLAR